MVNSNLLPLAKWFESIKFENYPGQLALTSKTWIRWLWVRIPPVSQNKGQLLLTSKTFNRSSKIIWFLNLYVMNELLKVSLRQKAVFIPDATINTTALTGTTSLLLANLSSLGFGVSEPLLTALNHTSPVFQAKLLETFREVMGIDKNWTPLIKGWDTPTGESLIDHIVAFFYNVFKAEGTRLQCGHTIPPNTFPLERYNGCPFCGTPFQAGEIEYYKQGSELKVLDLWNTENAAGFLQDLLSSKTALDATQVDSLKILLTQFQVPDIKIGMKETLMVVIDTYISLEQAEKAQPLFTSPTDILRYLWYKHTGFLQIIQPKTIVNRKLSNQQHIGGIATKLSGTDLKLKYDRKMCLRVASWLNNLEMDIEQMCEIMHPKRGMWIRFIRALRLAEYSKRTGFAKLRGLLDVFYNEQYKVWQGRIDHYRLRYDAEKTFELLKQRPGLFARSLFANMLWFGSDITIPAFAEIIDKVPARLIFTLNMYADNYFDKTSTRAVKPLGGVSKIIPGNQLLSLYDEDQLAAMRNVIEDLCVMVVKKRFSAQENKNKTIYIDPMLYKIPVSIGDRSDNIQDLPSALMGTRFPVNGDTVRLFMQWGKDLPAQPMDMDLSCLVAYGSGAAAQCYFGNLVIPGCIHSGDIRNIPEKIGTAEYIDMNLKELQKSGAKYVTFTCNAYSPGGITPNMVIGWMNSEHPMKISETTGVAYDPSCVQHQVRIVNSLTKGMAFGVLDVNQCEIVWLEMPFTGQLAQNLDLKGITALIKKLDSKLSIGQLLQIKAEAQLLELSDQESADEVYTREWASNTAAVTQLLID